MPQTAALLRLASEVDEERALALRADFGDTAEGAVAVLLGTMFPALTPHHDWQLAALKAIALERGSERIRASSFNVAFTQAMARDAASDAARVLRRVSWGYKARIAFREALPRAQGGPDVDETAKELSHLAGAAFEFALAEAEAQAVRRFGVPLRADGGRSELVVFGMGKLGGLELNAGSDVDVVFAYDTDEGQSRVTLHEHWSYVARLVVKLIDEGTSDGQVFRVDLRLRPEGAQGPIVNATAAIERYYETWGRLWERSAWLRTRPIAGNRELGALLFREVFTPFVYRGEIEPEVATAMAELIERSRAEAHEDPKWDLKIGIGGIREAEFFVQSLQLIWGGRDPTLRVANTLAALRRLSSRGLVTAREARDIEHAYLLLRRVEHRIQWRTGVQTHRLPRDPVERARLARTMWYESLEQFDAALEKTRARVGSLFRSLAPSAPRPPSPYAPLEAWLDETPPPSAIPEIPLEMPEEVFDHLRALALKPDRLLGALTRERFPHLFNIVLEGIYDASDPVQAASYLASFMSRLSPASALVGAIADDPAPLSRFITILGASAFVGDAIVARPELSEDILFGEHMLGNIQPEVVVDYEIEMFRRGLAPSADAYEEREAFTAALRRAQGQVMVAVAAGDLAGLLQPRDVTRLLSRLADVILDRALGFELGGDPRGLSVIAVGKLGGNDLSYGSDLDVLFIYDSEAIPVNAHPPEFYTRSAQRVIRLISEPHGAGRGYELDTRLRPSGSQGLLVTSLDAFARYHGVPLSGRSKRQSSPPQVLSSGAAWERQALLRARVAAGDRELGQKLVQLAHQAAYKQGAPPADEVHRLRLRMERELTHERAGRYDIKLGAGGLLDVEFAVQWLQMRHGSDPAVRTTDTREALEALHHRGFLDGPNQKALRDGYEFLRTLEQRIRIFRGAGSSIVDEGVLGLEQLARRMGLRNMPDASAPRLLIERLRETKQAVRRAYLSVLGLSDEPES